MAYASATNVYQEILWH